LAARKIDAKSIMRLFAAITEPPFESISPAQHPRSRRLVVSVLQAFLNDVLVGGMQEMVVTAALL